MDPRRSFVTLARLEGVSTLLLFFVAMPLKYGAGFAHATQGPGWMHGVLFIGYTAALAWITYAEGWPMHRAALGFVVSFIPFGTFWFESRLPERG